MEKQNYYFDNNLQPPEDIAVVEKSTTSTRQRKKRRASGHHFSSPRKNSGSNKSLTEICTLDIRPGFRNSSSSESEASSEELERRSLPLKIRLNPMDFEYFTSVVRSGDELDHRWGVSQSDEKLNAMDDSQNKEENEKDEESKEKDDNSTSTGSPENHWKNMLDERIQAVLDSNASQYELSLVILQLLLASQEPETNGILELNSPAMHLLKFALDTLWALQFGSESTSKFSGLESATLKATAARLMLVALERVLQAEEPTTAVIHNGLLPMTLRLLEDACSKPISGGVNAEEGSLLQEFIFSIFHGIVTFLNFLIHHHRGANDKLKHFLELFQLLIESHEGKLLEKILLTIVELPSTDSTKSFNRAQKVIDMIGVLINSLKRLRQDFSHANHCRRPKHKACLDLDISETHHHLCVPSDSFSPENSNIVSPRISLSKSTCTVTSLFSNLTSLIKESHSFVWEDLQVRLIKVMTIVGTCCCFSSKLLLTSVISLLKKGNAQIYIPAVTLIEKTVFGELGGYPHGEETCTSCSSLNLTSWEFLECYVDILNLDNIKLCRIAMKHLLKVTPNSTFAVKQELFFRVFYPTFLKMKALTDVKKADAATQKFMIQSCLTAITNLIVNPAIFKKFIELDGLTEVLSLLSNEIFIKNVFSLLENSVIMEVKSIECSDENAKEQMFLDRPVTKVLFEFLKKETENLLNLLQDFPENENSQSVQENLKSRTVFHKASGVWKAAAGVALCSPRFRLEFENHEIFENTILLAETLVTFAASDKIKGIYLLCIFINKDRFIK